jgi:protease II
MCFLNRIKRVNSLTPTAPEYINNYQQILKTLIKEAKKREFEKCVSFAKNKTKTFWQIINKEMRNSRQKVGNTELRNNTEIITNPQQISEKFNSFFIESVQSLRMSNNLTWSLKPPSQNTNYFHASMFISPVTECT